MKKKSFQLKLSREALLFDSPLYILKGFLSMLTAYLVFSGHAIVGKDMISVLFGMMLTLEPVNRTGIKSAFNQVKATILGGIVTAILVRLLGVNWFTVPLGVALTMYIALKINWRFVSPVAIFTAIYMTQYIQLDLSGEPSMLLTLRLRLLALGAGIAVALFYNYVFSLFFYKKMLKKRLLYVLETFETLMISEAANKDIQQHKTEIIGLLTDMDALSGQLLDMAADRKNDADVLRYLSLITKTRDLCHYYLDAVMAKAGVSVLGEKEKTPEVIKGLVTEMKENM